MTLNFAAVAARWPMFVDGAAMTLDDIDRLLVAVMRVFAHIAARRDRLRAQRERVLHADDMRRERHVDMAVCRYRLPIAFTRLGIGNMDAGGCGWKAGIVHGSACRKGYEDHAGHAADLHKVTAQKVSTQE